MTTQPNPKGQTMPGKYEANEDQPLAETLYSLTLDGTCETGGSIEAPTGWFALVEDYNDSDWIVREDHDGFVTIDGPHEHIDIDPTTGGGYFQPARRIYDALTDEWIEWFGDDED